MKIAFGTDLGREGLDIAARSFEAVAEGARAAASEGVAFAGRAVEQGVDAAGMLLAARTPGAALAAQGAYARGVYESLVSQMARFGEIATATARASYAPVEAYVARPRRA